MTTPKFISIDGIDGVGKSTQIGRLSDYLAGQGQDVVCVRDPGTTEIGSKLRALLLDSELEMHRRTEALLFMASRCEMIEKTIRPALETGRTVISDRYLLSTVVYQSIGGKVPSSLLWELGHLVNDGVEPQLTILLDMPAADAVTRMEGPADRMEKRGVEYMEAVRQAFLDQLPSCGGTTLVVDAGQSADQVAKQVREAVQ